MLRSIEISSSKSLMNRALIIQSYFPEVKIHGHSNCEDVVHLRESLGRMKSEQELFVGEGGTTLRFLALRVSRIPGSWILRGKESLFGRPQQGLISLMKQLGVESDWQKDFVKIQSQGWKIPKDEIQIDVSASSQFATSLVLNSWDLPGELKFSILKNANSEGYFDLSLDMAKDAGLVLRESFNVTNNHRQFSISAKQKVKTDSLNLEIDVSSAFTMACLAALHQDTEIKNFPFSSIQPDREFLNIFQRMRINCSPYQDFLKIEKAKALSAVEVNLKNCPDLFPVLAVLCSQAEGTSRIYGATQLVHKESNRLLKTKELLDLCLIPNVLLKDSLEISGSKNVEKKDEFVFDPQSDHRMAMAAAVLKSVGYRIKIIHPEVVDKSFPEFWEMSGIRA